MSADPVALQVKDASPAAMNESEWATRVDLAACYRLVALNGWTDFPTTHISARLPDEPDHFLLNPYGMLFEQITASSLVKTDNDGNILDQTDATISRAGYKIHGAVLSGRPDANCTVHVHTRAGMAVSAQKDGLLPLTQPALRFYDNLAYHDFEGIVDDEAERARLISDLGNKHAMILRNHGLLTTGRSVAEAYSVAYALVTACQAQIDAQSGGAVLNPVPTEICERTAQQFKAYFKERPVEDKGWNGLLRWLDSVDPAYKT